MPRLLAAEREAPRDASPPSRTCRRPRADAGRCRRRAARSRGRCCSSPSPRPRRPSAGPPPSSASRTSASRASPSTMPAVRVDEDRAVAVAVVRDAERRAAVDHASRPAPRAAVEPQPQVDVAAVGLAADAARRRSRGPRNSRGATVVVAPLAQSTTIRSRPASVRVGRMSRRWRDVGSERSMPRTARRVAGRGPTSCCRRSIASTCARAPR